MQGGNTLPCIILHGIKHYNYEHLQYYGQAVRHPHAGREQERGREEAPRAGRGR